MLCFCLPAWAGILIVQSDKGPQFTDATTVILNGKDKALSLGKSAAGGAAAKLPQVHISGVLLKDRDAGVVGIYTSGAMEYLIPQGLPKGSPENPVEIWKTGKITYKKTASDKAGTDVPASSFVAFVPGGVDELVRLCVDSAALAVIGGKGKAFAAQVELMSAVARSYGSNPATASLEKYVQTAMRSRYDAFESGAGTLTDLEQGLGFVEMSKAVYPNQPEQQKLRDLITSRKAWVDRQIAILNALAAGSQWDTFLLAARGFERYEHIFPEIAKEHITVLQESQKWHMLAGAERKKDGDYEMAFREFHLASLRKPSDPATRVEAMQAWTEYSRRSAMDLQSKRARLSAGPQTTIERDLYFAEQNRQAKKLDDAMKNVQDAEAVLKSAVSGGSFSGETLKVLYSKADVLGAQDKISEALAVLDQYDLYAIDDERAPADKLRNQLLFSLENNLKSLKNETQAAWSDGNFGLTARLAAQTLRLKEDDLDGLYYAGVASLVRRQPKEARDFLTRYLQVSDSLDGDPEQRARLTLLLAGMPDAAKPAATGDANWLSGERLPKGTFYSPVSLAFQPAIDQIEASGKLRVSFEWAGEHLRSVTPAFEGNERSTGERKISFAYDNQVPQVYWASDDELGRPQAPFDPNGSYKGASVLLLNNPLVDPVALQRLTGKNVALGIAFNRFFNPFVWEKIYYFRLTYDDRGRVSHAQELSGPQGGPAQQALDFEWDGMQLTAIRGHIAQGENYSRTMQYQDGRLVSEEIQGQGKPQIKYTYVGNRIASAEATKDSTLDNRSRKVAFRASSPSTQVK